MKLNFTVAALFQSTPSPRRETVLLDKKTQCLLISIHSLPKEGDSLVLAFAYGLSNFNPLPPQGGRDLFCIAYKWHISYFNPLPPQGGRLKVKLEEHEAIRISIHSLPKEGDKKLTHWVRMEFISIHSLPKEGDNCVIAITHTKRLFQSTPSPRRETNRTYQIYMFIKFQSTPSPRRETSNVMMTFSSSQLFQSTPSPRRETKPVVLKGNTIEFQSTPSPRRETSISCFSIPLITYFNPLPPQGGRLFVVVLKATTSAYFNPLPPQGGRRVASCSLSFPFIFQSTPSPRRETY